jgi:hypothetical protein
VTIGWGPKRSVFSLSDLSAVIADRRWSEWLSVPYITLDLERLRQLTALFSPLLGCRSRISLSILSGFAS